MTSAIIRNHMPYTYMPLLLSSLTDDEVDAYIVEVQKAEKNEANWVIYVGETYRLPLADSDLLTWTSSDPSVVSIDWKMISRKSAGDTVITLSLPSGKQRDLKVRVTE